MVSFDTIADEFEEALDEEKTMNEDSIVKINEKSFRCDCGCNVFRKLIRNLNKYKCNSCGVVYLGE